MKKEGLSWKGISLLVSIPLFILTGLSLFIAPIVGIKYLSNMLFGKFFDVNKLSDTFFFLKLPEYYERGIFEAYSIDCGYTSWILLLFFFLAFVVLFICQYDKIKKDIKKHEKD